MLAVTGRACEARQGQAPRGREERAITTMMTNATTDTDTVPPALPERVPAEPRRTRAKPEISRGRTSIRFNPFRHDRVQAGKALLLLEEKSFTP